MRSNIESEAGSNAEHDLQVFGLAEVQAMAEAGYGVIPLVERFKLTETAGAVYERLRGDGPSFMMESAETDERQGRYSFIGVDPEAIIRLENGQMMVNGEPQEFEDPYDFVEDLVTGRKVAPVEDLPPYFGGAAGSFGYDLARYREPSIGQPNADPLDLPELALMIPKATIAFDHYKKEVSIISNVTVDPNDDPVAVLEAYNDSVNAIACVKQRMADREPVQEQPANYEHLEFSSNMSEQEYEDAVEQGIEYIKAGDVSQVVPSQRFSSDKPVDKDFAYKAYEELTRLNPSRYAFVFNFGDFQMAGCSPETLVRVTGNEVDHMAIAGTRARGETPEKDLELADELLADEKETAEHQMLVDLSRNDVSKVSDAGSIEVPVHMKVEKYSHVLHLTSEIKGRLAPDKTALDALASIMPAGTLSGAPKIRAMQIIDELEPDKRGLYGGAVGYLNSSGNLDSCIFIRSLIVDKKGYVHVQAGAGVVADSDPTSELNETVIKAAAPIRAINAVTNPIQKRQRLVDAVVNNGANRRPLIGPALKHVLLIDNYDSYVQNLANFLMIAGATVELVRNDISYDEMKEYKPDLVVVSPGPKTPQDAGISIDAMRLFPDRGVPTLGVCLGNQALVAAYGGEVGRYTPVHGKTSKVIHDGKTIFRGINMNPLEVMRYHSLIADSVLPKELERSVYFKESDGKNIVMGVRHKDLPAEGVQFHPESLYTQQGQTMINNFVRL